MPIQDTDTDLRYEGESVAAYEERTRPYRDKHQDGGLTDTEVEAVLSGEYTSKELRYFGLTAAEGVVSR